MLKLASAPVIFNMSALTARNIDLRNAYSKIVDKIDFSAQVLYK